MDLRATQAPLKERYREDADAARITLTADGSAADGPISCSVDLGRAIYEAQAHVGVGGAGFESLRLRIDVDAPDATDQQLTKLGEKTERYCTVAQTLMQPPPLQVEMFRA